MVLIELSYKNERVKLKKKYLIYFITLLVLISSLLLFYFNFTIFVIQPVGAIPKGQTLIISKLNKTKFIDSADAMCDRIQGGVSLLCRGIVLGQVAKNAKIYFRLPYFEALYNLSTGGKRYSK